MITTLFIATLERAVQYYLRLDKDTLAQLNTLSRKVLHIYIKDWNITLYIFPNTQGIRLQGEYQAIPDVSISGNLSAFIKFALSKENFGLPQDLDIAGDTMLAQKFSDIASRSRIDWEEIFSLFAGDGIAHQAGNIFRQVKLFKQHAQKNIQENVTEYLQEEIRLMPPRQEVEDFFEDIYVLKNDTERLNAIFNRMQQKMDIES